MKGDAAHFETEKKLVELERKIQKVYKQAADEMRDTVTSYFARFEKRDEKQREALKAGDITEKQYKEWRLAQIGRGERFREMRDKLAERYTKANEIAVAYVNDSTAEIYCLNHNYEVNRILNSLNGEGDGD